MRAVTTPGRWVWAVSGLAAAAALAVPGTYLMTMAHVSQVQARPVAITTRTVTVPQPVTSLSVQSYGGQVRVTAGRVSRVQVSERIVYDPRTGLPAVAESVSGGRLSLGDPACAGTDCVVDFTVTVPSAIGVTIDTQGGPVAVSGTVDTTVDSGGGPVQITQTAGPLTVRTGGGPLILNEVAGPLRADTSGGTLAAREITAAKAILSTGGGPAVIAFAADPDSVTVSTDGGPATLRVPGGPYRLTADSDGGPEIVGIATDPAARPSIHISSGGGPLQLEPAR